MALPDVTPWIKWWASIYSNSTTVSTGITFLHLAGLVVGGGAAVTTDRQILRAWRRGDAARPAVLDDVAAVHSFVVGGLALVVVTGALMMFADWETFRASRLFWSKMVGVALLLANGALLGFAERTARTSEGRRGWPLLATASTISFIAWLGVLGLGTWLKTGA